MYTFTLAQDIAGRSKRQSAKEGRAYRTEETRRPRETVCWARVMLGGVLSRCCSSMVGELGEVLEMGRVRGSSRVAGDTLTMTKPPSSFPTLVTLGSYTNIPDQNNFRLQVRAKDDIASKTCFILQIFHLYLCKLRLLQLKSWLRKFTFRNM
jgi:hypothetical protein